MSATENRISLLAAGDIRVYGDRSEHAFDQVSSTLKQGDVVFAQLECAYSERGECAVNLGHGLRNHPRNVPFIAAAGFNVISLASNHTMDYGPDALLDTIDHLKKNAIQVIGAGRNIKEARTPAVFEINGTKVAILGYNAILQPHWEAHEEWPGQAPLKVKTFYEQVDWQPGTPSKVWTIPVEADVKAIEKDIADTRKIADVVVVSVHWGIHQMTDLAMYQREVGHRIIDAGADLIVGHHTHCLNPIEQYKGKFIFYGLGNFAFEHTRNNKDPYRMLVMELYGNLKKGLDPSKTVNEDHTILVKVDIVDKQLQQVSFIPVTGDEHHEPRIISPTGREGKEIIDFLERISKDFDVKFIVEGNDVVLQ
jgi:poly-gamma-glutamate capsule biosynthesis protein CapA/YwtB (metallophosphatase superfamily)